MRTYDLIVDRPTDCSDVDSVVMVQLETGERYRFFILDLSDEEYISRARTMKQIEDMRNVRIFLR